MSGFETSYSYEDELFPEGDYECIIASAEETSTMNGYTYFSVKLTIRNDVAQNCQNRNFYHAIWERKPEKQTENDKKVGGYSFKQIMNLAQAAGLPNGKAYETLNDLGADLNNRCVVASIVHSEWNGKVSAKVKWFNSTKHPDCKHEVKKVTNPTVQTYAAGNDQGTDQGTYVIPNDGDLPF